MKKYDGLYIFAGSVKDDVLEACIAKMREEITRLGGKVIRTENLGRRTFAHPIQKRDNGVYAKIRFELDPAQVKTLVDRGHLIDELVRAQFLAVNEKVEAVLAEQAAARKLREATRAAAAAEAAQAVEEVQA